MLAPKNDSKDLKITRFYDAPLKAVWDAWTDPVQTAKWWGPRGFTITTHSKDLRAGGHWSYTMHGPDGVDYENTTKYFEVEKYQRLVYDHGGHKDRPPLFRVSVEFHEIKGKTRMDMTMSFASHEAAKESAKFIRQASGNSTWDRLGEYLEKESSGKEIFVINRSFNAPIGTMWEMWTNPKHFAKWLAPTGLEMQFLDSDIRAGSTTFYSMSNDAGMTMYGKAHYLEIQKPNLLKYTQIFTDEKGKVSRHPAAPTWPEKMMTTVRFAEEEANVTRVTVTWEVAGPATSEEVRTFIAGRAGMTQGWTGSLDKLEDYLTRSDA